MQPCNTWPIWRHFGTTAPSKLSVKFLSRWHEDVRRNHDEKVPRLGEKKGISAAFHPMRLVAKPKLSLALDLRILVPLSHPESRKTIDNLQDFFAQHFYQTFWSKKIRSVFFFWSKKPSAVISKNRPSWSPWPSLPSPAPWVAVSPHGSWPSSSHPSLCSQWPKAFHTQSLSNGEATKIEQWFQQFVQISTPATSNSLLRNTHWTCHAESNDRFRRCKLTAPHELVDPWVDEIHVRSPVKVLLKQKSKDLCMLNVPCLLCLSLCLYYYQRKFRNLTSDYTESCRWRSVSQKMWSQMWYSRDVTDAILAGIAWNAVFP